MSSPPIPTLKLATREIHIAQVSYPPQLTTLNIITICLSTGLIVATLLAILYIQQRKDKSVFIADNAHPEDPEVRLKSSASVHNVELGDPDSCVPGPRYAESLFTPTPEGSPRYDLYKLNTYPTPSINVSPPPASPLRTSTSKYAADNESTMSGTTYLEDMYHGNVNRKNTKKDVYKWLGRSDFEEGDDPKQDSREGSELQRDSHYQNPGRRVILNEERSGPIWDARRGLNLGSQYAPSYEPSTVSNARTATEDDWSVRRR